MGGWSWTRQRAVIVKEFWALLRDPRGRIVLFVPPLMQLLLFSFAATLEVKNVDLGLVDRSGGATSAELIQRLDASPNIRDIVPFRSTAELRAAIDRQDILAAVVIEADFDNKVARGDPAHFGLVLDGRRSNAAQIVGSYVNAIAGGMNAELAPRIAEASGSSEAINWFNPNLAFIWFNLPALIAIIVSVSGLSVTAQVVARERELGTFDQLMVSPLLVSEILIGKMAPTFCVGMINGALFFFAAQYAFGVPFTGNPLLFGLSLATYNISLIGLGMAVSAASKTMQQAFLGSFLVTTPLIMLSGFSSPVENMPGWMQVITLANPARWFLQISLGSFLKAMPAEVVLSLTWPMALIAVLTLGFASYMFRARME